MKHFKIEEFTCKCGCKRTKVDSEFGEMMDKAREEAKVPFVITSGYRCPTYNISVGGKSGSAHVKGMAADIAVDNSWERYHVVNGLMRAGFNRIGVGRKFIHADSDQTKPEGVIWHYYG
jgi:uncharacterized protein YcbK (DUF882 family)